MLGITPVVEVNGDMPHARGLQHRKQRGLVERCHVPGYVSSNSIDLADRKRGCLFAGVVGDALGAPIEFDSLSKFTAGSGPVT